MRSSVKRTLHLVVLILLLFSLPLVEGFGIRSPGKKIIDFSPGYSITYDFGITTTGKDVKITAGGYHPEYVTFSRDFIAGDAEDKSFKVTVTLPQEQAEPGHQLIAIRADEISGSGVSGAGGSFIMGAGTFISLNVLHKTAFLESSFSVNNINKGDDAFFVFQANNFGQPSISNIRGQIIVSDLDNNTIFSGTTESISVDSWESGSVMYTKNTSNMSLGTYKVYATLYWGNNQTVFERDFLIGGELVKIINFTKKYTANSINKVQIEAENLGNVQLRNTRTEIEFKNSLGEIVGDKVITQSYELPKWSKIIMEGFWDATEVEPGHYIADIVVLFDGGKTSTSKPVNVIRGTSSEFPFPSSLVSTILGGLLIILLLLLLVGSFIYLVIRHKKRQ